MVIAIQALLYPAAVRSLQDCSQPVGVELVAAEEAEVLLPLVPDEDVAQHHAELADGLVQLPRRSLHLDGVTGVLRQVERHQHAASVRVRAGAHPLPPAARPRRAET